MNLAHSHVYSWVQNLSFKFNAKGRIHQVLWIMNWIIFIWAEWIENRKHNKGNNNNMFLYYTNSFSSFLFRITFTNTPTNPVQTTFAQISIHFRYLSFIWNVFQFFSFFFFIFIFILIRREQSPATYQDYTLQ